MLLVYFAKFGPNYAGLSLKGGDWGFPLANKNVTPVTAFIGK